MGRFSRLYDWTHWQHGNGSRGEEALPHAAVVGGLVDPERGHHSSLVIAPSHLLEPAELADSGGGAICPHLSSYTRSY